MPRRAQGEGCRAHRPRHFGGNPPQVSRAAARLRPAARAGWRGGRSSLGVARDPLAPGRRRAGGPSIHSAPTEAPAPWPLDGSWCARRLQIGNGAPQRSRWRRSVPDSATNLPPAARANRSPMTSRPRDGRSTRSPRRRPRPPGGLYLHPQNPLVSSAPTRRQIKSMPPPVLGFDVATLSTFHRRRYTRASRRARPWTGTSQTRSRCRAVREVLPGTRSMRRLPATSPRWCGPRGRW